MTRVMRCRGGIARETDRGKKTVPIQFKFRRTSGGIEHLPPGKSAKGTQGISGFSDLIVTLSCLT